MNTTSDALLYQIALSALGINVFGLLLNSMNWFFLRKRHWGIKRNWNRVCAISFLVSSWVVIYFVSVRRVDADLDLFVVTDAVYLYGTTYLCLSAIFALWLARIKPSKKSFIIACCLCILYVALLLACRALAVPASENRVWLMVSLTFSLGYSLMLWLSISMEIIVNSRFTHTGVFLWGALGILSQQMLLTWLIYYSMNEYQESHIREYAYVFRANVYLSLAVFAVMIAVYLMYFMFTSQRRETLSGEQKVQRF